MEHLALEVFDLATTENPNPTGSQYAVLEPDATITITDTSEIFANGDVWSYDFQLNIPANAHIFGTAGEIHGSRLHEQINKRKARLWVEGLPLYLGYLTLGNEAEVDAKGNVDVTFESGQKTFEELLDGLNARDIPMMGDHLIGVAVWRDRLPRVRITYRVAATEVWAESVGTAYSDERTVDVDLALNDNQLATRWPKYVIHDGVFKKTNGENYVVNRSETINTDVPYDDNAPTAHPYCNVEIGYQQKDDEGNAVRGYTIHESTWPNTAPCFYVMYWLRALMAHLGIYIEENQMQDVEDLRRLFFMNTLCAYDEPEKAPTSSSGETKNLRLTGNLLPSEVRYEYDLSESKGITTNSTITVIEHESMAPSIENPTFEVTKVESLGDETIIGHPAYATPDCFPNVDSNEIITALNEGFGVRFLFDNDYRRVRIVLLREIFRSTDIAELKCEIISSTKTENAIRGFMMSYSGDDTAFKLPIFDKVLDKEHDVDTTGNNYTLTSAVYSDVIKQASAFNKHLYYTDNGNAYAYKVDEEAKRYKDLYPSLLEVASFIDAVDGKCSGEDGTFESHTLNFTPLIVNDANMEAEKKGSKEQKFFAFVGEEMKKTDSDFSVTGDLFFQASAKGAIIETERDWNYSHGKWSVDIDVEGYIYETYKLRLKDNFDANDDGVAPIEKHEWGLTLGVMRGSGSGAYVKYDPDPFDGEGNNTWYIVPGGSETAHPDTCDSYGNEWFYNPGVGQETIEVVTNQEAVAELQNQFPNSNAPFYDADKGYLTIAGVGTIYTKDGKAHRTLFGWGYSKVGALYTNPIVADYQTELMTPYRSAEDIMKYDASPNGKHLIIELDSSGARKDTLLALCQKAYGDTTNASILIDHGIGSRYGRFSLKLRAEKPNPDFNNELPEGENNNRFLRIANENLRQRGLCDQFYKEYSYWVRNARIVKRTVRMTLAQLLTIDKTKRVRVGDVTGFIRKMQYTVSNETGLGNVTLEIMYI